MDPVGELNERVARLEGVIEASRAENDAMESRIDARLAGMEADMAKRENRLVFYMIAIVGIGLTIFGFVTA